MKDMHFQLNLSPVDAVMGKGELHFVQKINDETVTLLGATQGAVSLSFSHQELAKLLDEGHFSIEYGYFSDRRAARNARASRSLVSKLSRKIQVEACLGEAWCEAMLQGEREGWFNRSSKRWTEFLPKLHDCAKQKFEQGVLKALDGEAMEPRLLSYVPSRTKAMRLLRAWEGSRDLMV